MTRGRWSAAALSLQNMWAMVRVELCTYPAFDADRGCATPHCGCGRTDAPGPPARQQQRKIKAAAQHALPRRTYIIEERKGQGAKPKTVKTASPPLPAPHRRLRRPFPPRQGEKTGAVFGRKKTDQGQFYARSIIKVHFLVEFLSPVGGGGPAHRNERRGDAVDPRK